MHYERKEGHMHIVFDKEDKDFEERLRVERLESEYVIYQKLLKMNYEDMINGAIERL